MHTDGLFRQNSVFIPITWLKKRSLQTDMSRSLGLRVYLFVFLFHLFYFGLVLVFCF